MLPIAEPPLSASLIRDRYDRIATRLREAAAAAGRDPDGFRIVAVTKGFEAGVVAAAREAGLSLFGESRVQEALPKTVVAPDAEWHLVGHLQANKARPALRVFDVIHSVDSLELLQRIDRIAEEDGHSPKLCLQVNVADEAGKAGFEAAWFADLAARAGELVDGVRRLRASRVIGLMAIAPFGLPQADLRAVFASLRLLRDTLEATLGDRLPELSMGMTADADAAVAEGATLVRIGTGIFGPRTA